MTLGRRSILKPVAVKANDKKKDSEEQKLEDENCRKKE